MAQLVASILGFALGLLLLPALIGGMRVRGMGAALQVGLVCGVLSTFVGKLLVAVLSIIFLPIVLLGPIGVLLIQAFVNGLLLFVATRFVSGIEFDRMRSMVWAAVALTILQWVAGRLV
jgi:uncharacterized membrane protein YvlD (DUF360 family)